LFVYEDYYRAVGTLLMSIGNTFDDETTDFRTGSRLGARLLAQWIAALISCRGKR
jgi:hypothetical protein